MNSDAQLLLRYTRTGDPMAFTEIASRYRNFVFGVARRIVGNHHDAEDIAQAVFVELASKASVVRESLPGWLHRRSTTSALNHKRAVGRRLRQERQSIEHAVVSDHPSWDQIGPAVDAAIDQLPESLRHYVILYYLQGLSQDEVADILAVSRATAGRKLQEGIALLRDIVDKNSSLSIATLSFLLQNNAHAIAPGSLATSLVKIGMAGIGVPKNIALASHVSLFARVTASSLIFKGFVFLLLISTVVFIYDRRWHLSGLQLTNSAAVSFATYDQLREAYRSYLNEQDPAGLPLRIREAAASPYGMWCADQDLFFDWVKLHGADLFTDPSITAPCPLNPDIQDITFTKSGAAAASIGFRSFEGLTNVPIPLEILHGTEALRIVALKQYLSLTAPDRRHMDTVFLDAYRTGMQKTSEDVAAAFLKYQPELSRVSGKSDKPQYEKIVPDMDGTWHLATNRKGNGGVKVDLLPAKEDLLDIQESIYDSANQNSPLISAIRNAFPSSSIHPIQAFRILSPASRFTQGQRRYLITLSTESANSDAIIELVQHVPSAAYRAHMELDPDFDSVESHSLPTSCSFLGYLSIKGTCFLVRGLPVRQGTVKCSGLRDRSQLNDLAYAFGMLLGNLHAHDPHVTNISQVLNEALRSRITELANEYTEYHMRCYTMLAADPRTRNATDTSKQSVLGKSSLNDEF